MSVRHIDSHPDRAAKLLLPDTFVAAMKALGGKPVRGFPSFYRLRRRKEGAGVELIWPRGPHGGELVVNANYQFNYWPANFTAARAWVAELSQRIGFEVQERKPVRLRIVNTPIPRSRCAAHGDSGEALRAYDEQNEGKA